MSSNTSSSGTPDPWAWLGLLKWSLTYSDGTKDSSDIQPMSEEDKAFLAKVMKEGIIDENERMKTILKEVTCRMDQWKQQSQELSSSSWLYQDEKLQEESDHVEDLLQELRDIVEHIDYARAFAAMKGLVFLLGCAEERKCIPVTTRTLCLGILSTLAQHNPAVQKELLELGAIRKLSDLFFVENNCATSSSHDGDGKLRSKIMQAISAIVRSHDLGEAVFCRLEQAKPLIEAGLILRKDHEGATPQPLPAVLVKRTLFFLRALVTSDTADFDRVRQFSSCINLAVDQYLLPLQVGENKKISDYFGNETGEICEMVLVLVEQILEQTKSVDCLMIRQDALVAASVPHIATLRHTIASEDSSDDSENAAVQLQHWERVLALMANAREQGAI